MVGTITEDSVDDDLARLLDGKELVASEVLGPEVRLSEACLAHVVVRAVEALVANANNLVVADIADDILVNEAPGGLGREVRCGRRLRSLGPTTSMVRTDPVVLHVVGRDSHGEERVRNVVLGTTLRIGDARCAKVVVCNKDESRITRCTVQPTTTIQAFMPNADDRGLPTAVAVDLSVLHLWSRGNDGRLFHLLACLLICVLRTGLRDREENVGYIVFLAHLRAGHAVVTEVKI